MVSGNLRKRIATGPSTMRYEVGTGSTYAPVDLTFGNVSTAGYVAVSTTGSEHPSVATSGINTARSINRWWSVANVGTGFDSCAATFNFAAADVDPGADPTGFGVRRYVVPNWSGPRTGARTATSIQALGLTGFGDFAAGDVTTYTLNVTTVGSGTVSKNPSDPSYGAGSSVVLTANPSTGWHFVGWSGDTVSANNPITMTMNGNKNVIATFAINTYTLNVTAVGNGAVTRNPSQATYTHGTSVTLTATSQAGYHLVSWSGDTTGTTNPLTFNMTANKNITATFAINTYTLDVSIVGGGTVTRTPNQATYDHGTGVTLTATPANGYHFVGWTGDTSTTASSIGFVMTVNKSVTATFAINTYTVTRQHGGQRHGDEEPEPGDLRSRHQPDPHRHAIGRVPFRELERRHHHVDQPADPHRHRRPQSHRHLRPQRSQDLAPAPPGVGTGRAGPTPATGPVAPCRSRPTASCSTTST